MTDGHDDRYEALHRSFHWQVPVLYNLAEVCCARWARDRQAGGRVAVCHEDEHGQTTRLTYAELQAQANRLSNALARRGIVEGDRVALLLPQRCETAVALIALFQLGAIAVPLSTQFGPEALAQRLQDSAALLVIADAAAGEALQAARTVCPGLQGVITLGTPAQDGDGGWATTLAREPDQFAMLYTHADDPALLIYTSGTTGPAKGALIPHRALIGNLSGFVCSQNWFPQPDDVFWSPADWAWTGGLMDVLLPVLYFGRTVIASNARFEPQRAFELMERHGVTNSFLFPTALKAMMKAVPAPRQRYRLRLRALMSAGEAVGSAVYAYCRDALGVPVNEMFGQTEANYVVGNCGLSRDAQGRPAPGWPSRPGSMGRPYPGHRVAVIDDAGQPCPPGVIGEIAVHRLDRHGHPDPVFFLGYWQNDAATAAKFNGDWCCTGDLGQVDADGYFWYAGRRDDVFKSAGYRIGPGEIENCLQGHPAVALAAVVPTPDAERGALVKAFVVLAAGTSASDALVTELQQHVRARLAPYETPKHIEFVDSLPMTPTGKVQRQVLRQRERDAAASR